MLEMSPEFFAKYPLLAALFSFATVLFYLAAIWVFARMGDNVNKIRKLVEREINKRNAS